MKRSIRFKGSFQQKIPFTLIMMIILACESQQPQPLTNPPDAFEQNRRLGRGGNLGDILYKFEIWEKEKDLEQLDLIKNIGMTGLRINTGPFDYVTVEPPFTLSNDFLERLDWTVDEALKRGFTVIIDNHEYHAMADDPMGNMEMFLSTWRQLGERYKDYPDNLYFGVLNEPNGHLTPYLWNYILADALEVIRQSNPNRTLVIGPGTWNGIRSLEFIKLPEDDRNIIVEIHYYSPHRFTHQGASWSEGSDAWLGTTWRGEPQQKQAIIEDFRKAVDWATVNDRPLFLGEFGVYHRADIESREQWLRFVIQQAEENNISWAIWELMYPTFGIYDPSTKTWIEPLKNAILPPT